MVVLKKVFLLYIIVIISTTVVYCCVDCCDCCVPDVITEEDISEFTKDYQEPKDVDITTDGILKHLKLDNNQLNAIVEEVNNESKDIDKINKILEYTVDIDWDNPMCPNTLIKQKDNLCAYISYFHLMLNNPYFLKFFLICDKINSLHRPGTYVLDAMCELVCWCVDHPRFDKNNMGSVDKIMKAVFTKKKDSGEYFYCAKNEKNDKMLCVFFYGSRNEDGTWFCKPDSYGGFLDSCVYNRVNSCLFIDLQLSENEQDHVYAVTSILKTIMNPVETSSFVTLFLNEIGTEYEINKDSVSNLVNWDIFHLLKEEGNHKKLLGMHVYQTGYHFFAVPNYNGVFFYKNTLKTPSKMSMKDVLRLLNKVLKVSSSRTGEYDRITSVFWLLDEIVLPEEFTSKH